MSSNFFGRIATAVATTIVLAGTAEAASSVSSGSNFAGTVITFNEYDGLSTTGPLQLNPDVIFTSVPYALVGADAQDLQDNGLWGARGDIERAPGDGNVLISTPTGDGHFLASQFVAQRGELGFSFATPVAQVGAYFNQFQPYGATNNSMRLIVYDRYGNDLESFSFSVDTDPAGYNEGVFLGFSRASADIYGFGIADGTFVLDNLTYAVAEVPEPAALALLMAGGLGACGARRKRKSR
jgi:PEP-CTERM motif